MIYILGHSHAILPIRFMSAGAVAIDHYNFASAEQPVEFKELRCCAEYSLPEPARYFIIGGKSDVRASYATGAAGSKTITVTEAFMKLVQGMEHSHANQLFCFFNGAEYGVLSLIEHEVPYDFMRPGDDITAFAPPKQIVPLSIIRDQIGRVSQMTYAPLEALRAYLPEIRFYLICPPPPVGLNEQILAYRETFPEPLASAFRAGRKLNDPIIRLKYYQEYVSLLQSFAQHIKAQFIVPPPEACTREGFLSEAYWYDSTHGNEAYAKLVAGQIQECFQ